MRQILVVAEHPSMSLGFTTVASHVAHELTQRGCLVTYLGIGTPNAIQRRSYPVEAFDRLSHLADRVARSRPILLFFGRSRDVVELHEALAARGARRSVELVCYAPVDNCPAARAVDGLAGAVDQLVPATEFAARALGVPAERAIPHGVDATAFRRLDARRRVHVRSRDFGAGDQTVIGYFGRNTHHKRPDLALRAFAHIATGSYGTCSTCTRVTVAELGIDGRLAGVGHCRHCAGSTDPGVGLDGAILYMHTELLGARDRRACGGFDLELIADRLDVADRTVFDRTIAVGHGVPIEVLSERMAAIDIHVLLGVGGGWELTVLETGACGTPNVLTDYAAPAEYARPFAELVPVANAVMQPWGLECLVDLDVAVEKLRALATSPERRSQLGAAGIAVAKAHSWTHIGDRWHDLVDAIE